MLENAVVIVIVAIAAVFLAWQLIKTLIGREPGCQTGCGCGVSSKEPSRLGKRVDLVQLDANANRPPAK
jgi:hypothetical protein